MYPIFLHPTVGVPFICNRAPAAMANNLTRGRVIWRAQPTAKREGVSDAIPSNYMELSVRSSEYLNNDNK